MSNSGDDGLKNGKDDLANEVDRDLCYENPEKAHPYPDRRPDDRDDAHAQEAWQEYVYRQAPSSNRGSNS